MKSNHRPQQRTRLIRARRWFVRRRNVMMTSALRGTCYGIGAGAVGLVFWWCEQTL
ncbi:hypothetical protein ACQEVM_38185 [Streptomyces sp. CA-243310]|uniref:hypothetical protein n=1 Tax=Streptomyces sp. CA-243310 TaxID=3240056 RepID=UPI003D9195A1